MTTCNLFNGSLTCLPDVGDDRALSEFAETCSTTLSGILTDKSVDLRTSSAKPIETATASTSSKETGDPYAVKLMLLRDLWNVVSAIFGSNANAGLNNMLDTLVWNEPILVPTTAADSLAACNWTMACANVAKHSDGDLPRKFFDNDWEWTTEKQSYVWRCYSEYWRLDKGTWEGAVALLGVPFEYVDILFAWLILLMDSHSNRNSWDMLDRDLSEWDALLQYAIATGFDRGISSAAVLEKVTNSIERRHLITYELIVSCPLCSSLIHIFQIDCVDASRRPAAVKPGSLNRQRIRATTCSCRHCARHSRGEVSPGTEEQGRVAVAHPVTAECHRQVPREPTYCAPRGHAGRALCVDHR